MCYYNMSLRICHYIVRYIPDKEINKTDLPIKCFQNVIICPHPVHNRRLYCKMSEGADVPPSYPSLRLRPCPLTHMAASQRGFFVFLVR